MPTKLMNNMPIPVSNARDASAAPALSARIESAPLSEFRERLVRLSDGRPGLRGGLPVEIQVPSPATGDGHGDAAAGSAAPDPPRAIIDFIASSETLDRADEIILASGWRLEHYRRNPVFQNAHQYGDVIFTLGKALITEIRSGPPALDRRSSAPAALPSTAYLFQRVEFAVDANPMARIAYGLYRGKFLNAVSVGFIPICWENGGPEAGYRRRYLEQELLEVSAVGIPANPDALQLGLKAGAIDKTDLQELADLCRRSLEAAQSASPAPSAAPPSSINLQSPFLAAPNADTCALGVRSNEAQLLQLARALREFLRRT